jgi:hypothetical protein
LTPTPFGVVVVEIHTPSFTQRATVVVGDSRGRSSVTCVRVCNVSFE